LHLALSSTRNFKPNNPIAKNTVIPAPDNPIRGLAAAGIQQFNKIPRITSDLTGVVCQFGRMARCSISGITPLLCRLRRVFYLAGFPPARE
jgi:hypothetical protein